MKTGIFMDQFRRQDRLDDVFHHRFLQVFVFDVRVMLGGEDDCIDRAHFAILIA